MKSIKAFLPAIVWALVILYLSTGAAPNLPAEIWDLFQPDKLAHAAVYGLLTLLIIYGFHTLERKNRFAIFFAVFLSTLYGISMEIVQYTFFPNRYFEVLDIFANIIGTFGSLLLLKYFFK